MKKTTRRNLLKGLFSFGVGVTLGKLTAGGVKKLAPKQEGATLPLVTGAGRRSALIPESGTFITGLKTLLDCVSSGEMQAPGEEVLLYGISDTKCGRCGDEIPLGTAESCWYCHEWMCCECWDEHGHCGHPEAMIQEPDAPALYPKLYAKAMRKYAEAVGCEPLTKAEKMQAFLNALLERDHDHHVIRR